MEQRLSGRDVSFDPDPKDDEDFAPVAYLPSPNADPAQTIEQADWDTDANDRLDAALDTLDARSRNILARRWLRLLTRCQFNARLPDPRHHLWPVMASMQATAKFLDDLP